ncbi:hypothetical protein [Paracoccus alkanivorans]|uniref:Uncharacterized protein n=1 Tax=Paracoccus alkanivorans TaxID=2116655 RepID=A0A3M0M567_9RHOB|nr:hypothetical protein [Paracoccus alkanivorans]RMC32886.1 hypothetical protein C9E81_17760 [Paracoccus alkanivorans]
MNANQLINMFARLVTRRLMNWGINKGIRAASKSGRKRSGPGKRAGVNNKRTRQAMRILRRIGR